MFRNKKIIIEQYVNPFSTKCGVNGDNRCGDNRSFLADKFYKKYNNNGRSIPVLKKWFEGPHYIGTSDGIKKYCDSEDRMRSLYNFAIQSDIKVGTSDEFVQDYFCDMEWVSTSAEYSGSCLSSRGSAVSQDEREKLNIKRNQELIDAGVQDELDKREREKKAKEEAEKIKQANYAQQRALGAKLERERLGQQQQQPTPQSSQPNLVPVPIDPNEALRDKKGSYKKLIGKQ